MNYIILYIIRTLKNINENTTTYTYVHTYRYAVIESFRSAFTLNVDWPCDQRYDISIHGETVVKFRSA